MNVTTATEASFDTNEMSERLSVRGSQNPDVRAAPNSTLLVSYQVLIALRSVRKIPQA